VCSDDIKELKKIMEKILRKETRYSYGLGLWSMYYNPAV
jgi:hypothetical protein